MNKINYITQEDRDAFDRIDKDCLKMHVCPPPKTFINMKVHMPDGELVSELDMVSRSWVRNAYNFLFDNMTGIALSRAGNGFGGGYPTIKTTAGTVRYVAVNVPYPASGDPANYYAGIGVDTFGIQIGTGTGAESFEGYILGTKTAHGTSATQMSYAAQSAPSFAYDSGTKKMTAIHTRIFNNNSGSAIDVAEVGWVLSISCSQGDDKALFSRDLLAAAVSVANTAQLTVTYTIEMTFPA